MNIIVNKNKVNIDQRFWGKKPNNMDLGDYILNLLFYCNRDGKKDYSLIVNNVDETVDFKKAVKEKYQNIPNTSLRDSFFTYANVK